MGWSTARALFSWPSFKVAMLIPAVGSDGRDKSIRRIARRARPAAAPAGIPRRTFASEHTRIRSRTSASWRPSRADKSVNSGTAACMR